MEHFRQPLAPAGIFVSRMWRYVLVSVAVITVSLGAGVIGYHVLEGIPWVDSLLNASMILGGMGPVTELHTPAGKLFASAYALFSGLAFLGALGIILAPIVHRFLHRFQIEEEEEQGANGKAGEGR